MNTNDSRLSGCDYPCATLDEALSELRRPPASGAVRFKIQNTVESAAQVASYIDARLVFDRLDQVCGRRWTARFAPVHERLVPAPVDDDGQVLRHPPLYVACELTVLGVARRDVGEGSDAKAAYSDAVKRAAVQFGVGRALYALRSPWLVAGDADGELRRNRKGRLVLDERTERWCRSQYERWLDARGRSLFGEPLEHRQATAADGDQGEGTEPAASHLRVVDDPDVGEDELRRRVERWRAKAGLKGETVSALAALVLSQPEIDLLGRTQLAQLAWQLELVAKGRTGDRELAADIERTANSRDRDQALEQFTGRRIAAAQEVGLLGRRAVPTETRGDGSAEPEAA